MNQNLARRFRACGLIGVLSLLLVACGGSSDSESEGGQPQQQEAPPKEAEVMTLERRDLELDKTYPAMVRSDRSVDLVARVEGYLEAQNFEAGELVEQGDVLFVIEQAPYEAAVARARADLQSARANAQQAARDYERYQRLYQNGSISQQQRDQALSERDTTQAAVEQARAALESARIDLGYTEVTSPTEGYASLDRVNVGNYVSIQTLLASVTPVDPLEVRFSLPQDDAFALRRQRQMDDAPNISVELDFPLASNSTANLGSMTGELNFLGARVDASTSTVAARATFDNPDHLFLPGQFVRVSLRDLMRFDVLAVPEIAVTEGLKGPQVLIMSDDNQVQNRFVSLGEQAHNYVIITEGLEAGDRVVVSNIGGVSAGDRVDPQTFDGVDGATQDSGGEDRQSGSGAGQSGVGQNETGQNGADARGQGQ